MITFKIKNPPAGAAYWLPVVNQNGVISYPKNTDGSVRNLGLSEGWTVTNLSGSAQFRLDVLDGNEELLNQTNFTYYTFVDGQTYTWNWSTSLFETSGEPPDGGGVPVAVWVGLGIAAVIALALLSRK